MGILSNRVERSEIKAGDHIYTYRAIFTYSHHGIFVGGSKVVHFTPRRYANSSSESSDFYDSMSSIPSSCETFPDCGFKQPNSGVVLSCLDCFLGKGSLYCFEYGVPPSVFLAKVRGGTCTTALSDPPETVVHRAMYLLQNGFGNYDIFQNNCEDFTLYCKTGLLIMERQGVGRSGQASSFIGAPLAALLSSPLKLLMPSPVGVATVTAGMYCMSRYATDIGVRSDVIKVAVEDLSVNLGWAAPLVEVDDDNEASGRRIAPLVEVDGEDNEACGRQIAPLVEMDDADNEACGRRIAPLVEVDDEDNEACGRRIAPLVEVDDEDNEASGKLIAR